MAGDTSPRVRWWQTAWARALFVTAAFVAAIGIMVNDPAATDRHRTLCSGILAGLTLGAILVGVYHHVQRFRAIEKRANAAVADGRYSDAARLFAELAAHERNLPPFAAQAEYYRGYASMCDAQFASAAESLLRVEKLLAPNTPPLRRLVAITLTRCFALAGDLDQASHWLEMASERVAAVPSPWFESALWQVTGLVICRRGDFDEACRHYERGWKRFLPSVPRDERTEVGLLRAFAITHKHGQPRVASPWIKQLRRARRDGVYRLTAEWPEMATFATANGILATTDVAN
jgi:tetratricopeptide (TPR) repeat protein